VSTLDVDGSASEALRTTWHRPRDPLDSWVRAFSASYQESELSVEEVAEVVAATQAEVEAVLRLDALDDATLALVAIARPPMTTWLLLSEVPTQHIAKALAGLEGRPYGTAYESVRVVIQDLVGLPPAERVAVIDYHLLTVAHNKARQYGLWAGDRAKKNLKALKDFASIRRAGTTLTPKRAAYALGMLSELVDGGVVRVPSPDGDDTECAAIIEAIAE
jgi:hypothetical protein